MSVEEQEPVSVTLYSKQWEALLKTVDLKKLAYMTTGEEAYTAYQSIFHAVGAPDHLAHTPLPQSELSKMLDRQAEQRSADAKAQWDDL